MTIRETMELGIGLRSRWRLTVSQVGFSKVEPSSGNMCIPLASAAEGLGLKVEMVIPEMKSLMEKKAYNGLFDNSYSPASRPSRGEL